MMMNIIVTVLTHATNNALLVKIEGPVWYTIYHHRNLLLEGFLQPPLLINQPMGIWDIHACNNDRLPSMPVGGWFIHVYPVMFIHDKNRRIISETEDLQDSPLIFHW